MKKIEKINKWIKEHRSDYFMILTIFCFVLGKITGIETFVYLGGFFFISFLASIIGKEIGQNTTINNNIVFKVANEKEEKQK